MSTIELIKIDTIKLPIVNIRHLAILWGDLLKNPPGDCGKVSRRACVLRQHARTTRNQSIDDRHLCYSTIYEENYCSNLPSTHNTEKLIPGVKPDFYREKPFLAILGAKFVREKLLSDIAKP
jgi:hypothetical protein